MFLNKRSNFNTLSKPVRAYLLYCVLYADQLFFAVITTPRCMLLSCWHHKHFADSAQGSVGTALISELTWSVWETFITHSITVFYSMGSETVKHYAAGSWEAN